MLSTTDRRPAERGQILVIFAGGFLLICLIAALVFDVGQNLLDRRAEQNAETLRPSPALGTSRRRLSITAAAHLPPDSARPRSMRGSGCEWIRRWGVEPNGSSRYAPDRPFDEGGSSQSHRSADRSNPPVIFLGCHRGDAAAHRRDGGGDEQHRPRLAVLTARARSAWLWNEQDHWLAWNRRHNERNRPCHSDCATARARSS